MDPVDYVNWGFIGCSPKKNISWNNLVNDPGEYQYSSWESARTTFFASRDAFRKALAEMIQSNGAMYKYEDVQDEQFIARIVTNIDINGQQKFINSVNDIYDKDLIFFKNAQIFWNTFPMSDKLNDVRQYDFVRMSVEPFIDVVSYLTESYTIDYSLYPKLTREIYDNYFDSLSEYIFSIKRYFKVSSNTDFEKFIIPQ